MASSENMVSMEPWLFRHAFGGDSWLVDTLSRETETIAKALQKSFSGQVVGDVSSDDFITTSFQTQTPTQTPTPTTTTVSGGSENDSVVVSRRRSNAAVGGVAATGKITKRKSRASKRATTTFITADPANFRQMVQQVTGVRLNGNGQLEVAPLLKPEPHRLVNRLQPVVVGGGASSSSSCLPTLDTSAFLLEPTHHHQGVGPASSIFCQPPAISVPPPSLVVADGGSAPALDFDSFSSFPTLESWKAM